MDLHKADDYGEKPTLEDIKRNHIADLKTQAKYGVRFLQYWINEDAGLVFCLMEGPDKDSCVATHQEAHGDIACNVIELKGGDYQIFMGEGKVNEFDITEDAQGALDPGTRSFLVADVICLSPEPFSFNKLKEIALRFKGREVDFNNGRIKFVFNSPSNAVDCARTLHEEFKAMDNEKTQISMTICTGPPVTEHRIIFADVLQLSDCLCDITMNGQITVSSQTVNAYSDGLHDTNNGTYFKILSQKDEKFINILMTALAPMIFTDQFSILNLCKLVGTSQPQLYRKVIALTGRSPNALIHEMRLKKSLRLLNKDFGNVTQVAFASGFNSPSYFTKSFKKRFGTSPANVPKS
ncbi:MAG: nickel-binding protein [Chryseolinea sp.]